MKLANRVKTAAESATESEKDGASFCVNSMICTAQIFLTTILAPRGEREKREREERERERERDLFNDEGNRAPVSRAAPSIEVGGTRSYLSPRWAR